jgi:dTDP-4-amino-4,6-dideoxygalactose transaminase
MLEQQPMRVPFVDLAAQYASIGPQIDQAISNVLRKTDFILGKELNLFEEEFAAFCGTKFAVGVDSGTSALELALRAFGIGAGDQVITAANTYIATALAITYTGATPVLVDVDASTYTLDLKRLEEAITPRTKTIIPVHLYGRSADMDPILELARKHSLIVLEDACQAHGATYKGKRVGSMGNAAAFSFYPAKNLGAYGDGGMIVTDDERMAIALRMLRDYGQSQKYHHEIIGYNRRLDTLQAAVLRVKLKHLDAWNNARRENARLYNHFLRNSEIILPGEADYSEPVWHLYAIRAAERDALREFLSSRGIATGIHYPIPIHRQPAYRDLGYPQGQFPVSERCADELVSLPMYAELTPVQIEYVAAAVDEFASGHQAEAHRL